ncbi:hypothetical protein BDZ91DRAFT_791224 [Kalaharituber pfeilii]|nr:hypothetical protein BDZ91DRAFT_791224 [Kalaharituber pfeilii]
MEGRMMPFCEPGSQLLSTALLPLTFTNATLMFTTSIPLGPSMQGASQFLIFLPPGIEPWGIICRTVPGDPETLLDNLPAGLEDQQFHVRDIHTWNCNQAPPLVNTSFPEYDPITTSNTIDNSVSNHVSSAVPAPWSNYLQIVNHPMGECLPYGNRDSTEEIFSGIMDQRDMGMHFNSQNAQLTPNAVAAASQPSELIFWMSPNIPHNFVPAPSLPEYDIRFEEPVTLTAPPTPY